MPGQRNLSLYRGDDYSHRVTFVDAAGAPLPVPGVYLAQIRRSPRSADVLATFSVDTSAVGVLTLSLPGATVATLPAVTQWDLQRTNAGVVQTLLHGSVTCREDVSR